MEDARYFIHLIISPIDERTRLINKRYFLDRGFEQLNQEAFIYRNFLTESECDEIVEEVKSTQEYKDGKPFIYINSIKKYRDRIKSLLDIENPLLSDDVDHVIVRWRGHRDFPHCDVLRHVHDFIENWSWDETGVHRWQYINYKWNYLFNLFFCKSQYYSVV